MKMGRIMTTRADRLLPFERFFAAGFYGRGALVLLLQLSLVFWPLAIRMARQFEEARGVQKFLDQLAAQYSSPGAVNLTAKRFAQPEMV
jgi:hypothetical protein